ncbi:MAG: hypothetical protein JSW50_12770 [Candidatus Latescibacterota bacterium]|nr:MAG: hypothetical protein JSW50_12770 [Candidatus Latescibacterota bacterium]
MKSLLIFVFLIAISANLAFAQAGYIAISADVLGLDCNLLDIPGLVSYNAVHKDTPGATACSFMATIPACMTAAIWLSDTAIFPVTIGNSQTGVAIGYGACLASPIHVLVINYFGQGLTSPCCVYKPTAHPGAPSGEIEVVDCNDQLLDGGALCAIINPDTSCPCWATPVEKSTWGKVKELYAH